MLIYRVTFDDQWSDVVNRSGEINHMEEDALDSNYLLLAYERGIKRLHLAKSDIQTVRLEGCGDDEVRSFAQGTTNKYIYFIRTRFESCIYRYSRFMYTSATMINNGCQYRYNSSYVLTSIFAIDPDHYYVSNSAYVNDNYPLLEFSDTNVALKVSKKIPRIIKRICCMDENSRKITVIGVDFFAYITTSTKELELQAETRLSHGGHNALKVFLFNPEAMIMVYPYIYFLANLKHDYKILLIYLGSNKEAIDICRIAAKICMHLSRPLSSFAMIQDTLYAATGDRRIVKMKGK